MSKSNAESLLTAISQIFRPLARILIRNGIDISTVQSVLRKAYVDEARTSFQPPGKKQNLSRIATLTGLSRKEVKRLTELPDDGINTAQLRYNRATRVISGWLNDSRFCDNSGRPVPLPVEGEISFAKLVADYSGDIPPSTLLSLLETGGAIRRQQDEIILVQHAYIPFRDEADKLYILGNDATELISTIDFNLQAAPDQLRFQRKLSDEEVPVEILPAIRRLFAKRSQGLLEELDETLNLMKPENQPDCNQRYVSLGIYYFESPATAEQEDKNQ